MLIRIFFRDGSMDVLRVARVPVTGDYLTVRTNMYKVIKVNLIAQTSMAKGTECAYIDVE